MHPDHVTLTADEIEAAADKLLGQYTADGYSQVTLPNLINFVSALVMFTVLDKAQPDKHAAFDEFRTALRRLGNANDPLSVADRVMILSNATFLLDEYARAHTPQPTTPRSTAEQIDAVFRRNLDLLIQNLTVDSDNKITWMAISCRGVEQSLYPLASKRVDRYQQLLGVAYVVLGCLAANGVDIPERFLDAFSDPDSVEKPLELLPFEYAAPKEGS